MTAPVKHGVTRLTPSGVEAIRDWIEDRLHDDRYDRTACLVGEMLLTVWNELDANGGIPMVQHVSVQAAEGE
jgi:hypothetical protein